MKFYIYIFILKFKKFSFTQGIYSNLSESINKLDIDSAMSSQALVSPRLAAGQVHIPS